MRKGAIPILLLLAVVAGAITTAVAILIDWLPEQASKEREGIDLVIWFTTAICITIWAIVAAVVVYSVAKFRAQPDDDSDGPPVHGHTGLEIVWTAIPAVLVIAIGVLSGVVLAQNDRADANPLRVQVVAQQFTWIFKYQNGVVSPNLHLPVDRSTVLELRARDVVHSFWVKEFGQTQDAVPGIRTRLVITPTKRGNYAVICKELCGLGHSVMRSRAIVHTKAGFERWLTGERRKVSAPAGQAGASLFASQGCNACHALAKAQATAQTGPALEVAQLRESAAKAGQPLDEFVRTSIVDPEAYVHPGFPPNVMPPTYAELPDDQVDGLVEYLTAAK